jgi:hypothetical protein
VSVVLTAVPGLCLVLCIMGFAMFSAARTLRSRGEGNSTGRGYLAIAVVSLIVFIGSAIYLNVR